MGTRFLSRAVWMFLASLGVTRNYPLKTSPLCGHTSHSRTPVPQQGHTQGFPRPPPALGRAFPTPALNLRPYSSSSCRCVPFTALSLAHPDPSLCGHAPRSVPVS